MNNVSIPCARRTAMGEVGIGCTHHKNRRGPFPLGDVLPPVRVTTRDFLGGDSGRVIPDPIPNSVVKPSSVDGTARATLWESRTLPGSYFPTSPCDQTDRRGLWLFEAIPANHDPCVEPKKTLRARRRSATPPRFASASRRALPSIVGKEGLGLARRVCHCPSSFEVHEDDHGILWAVVLRRPCSVAEDGYLEIGKLVVGTR